MRNEYQCIDHYYESLPYWQMFVVQSLPLTQRLLLRLGLGRDGLPSGVVRPERDQLPARAALDVVAPEERYNKRIC